MNASPNSAILFTRKTRAKPPKMVARRFRRLFVPLIFILLILGAVVAVQKVFVIWTIACVMDDQPCPDPVTAELNRLRGKSIFFVETAELEEKLHAALPKAKDILFEKKPPQTVAVTIHSYPSAFFIHSGQYFFLANEGGVLIEQVEALPVNELDVTVNNDSLQVGSVIDAPTFSTLLTLVTELKKTSMVVIAVEYVNENEIILHLLDSRSAYLKSEDLPTQLTTLQRLVNDATMTERGHIFDVRFAHPVVKNAPPEAIDGEEQNNLGN